LTASGTLPECSAQRQVDLSSAEKAKQDAKFSALFSEVPKESTVAEVMHWLGKPESAHSPKSLDARYSVRRESGCWQLLFSLRARAGIAISKRV
jgi:hypothetical protein